MLRLGVGTLMGGALLGPGSACLRAAEDWASLERSFQGSARHLVEAACHECHAGEKTKGDVDLGQYRSVTDVRRDAKVWEGVLEQLESGEMPPKKAKPLAAEDRAALVAWVRGFLDTAANERAGDPGPVVLRRLSNAEYTYSVQDLTGLALQPAREFPADGAAGEGFMNAGQALVMSSALFGKYLDAAKGIAAHVVLLPDGFRFSEGTTRRDWSDEAVAAIRRFYAQYADGEGRLPVEASLRALLEWRERPSEGRPTLAAFAAERKLNARYLLGLQGALSGEGKGGWPAGWTERWATAKSTEAASLAADVAAWQKALWKVGTVGHMKPWMSPAQPVVYERELKWSAPKESATGGADVVVRWVVTEAGDGAAGDLVLWEQPRLKVPGREPLDLKEVRAWWAESRAWRTHLASQAAASLEAAVSASAAQGPGGDGELARTRGISVESLRVWKAFLGIGDAPVALEGHLGPEIRGVGGQ
ncbi:MAG: DUF1587 domain-containing protein, partial [Verrucomicrobiales bacterium]|nr:DUF1587 domain-containing protein [Verrucomicrobiales bacterium]